MIHRRFASRATLAACLVLALASAAGLVVAQATPIAAPPDSVLAQAGPPAAQPAPANAPPPPPAFHDEKKLPEGELGKRINDLLEAVNSNDTARVKAFVESNFAPAFRDAFPMDQHVNILLGAYERSRGLDFYSIRSYEGGRGPSRTVVIVSNRLTRAWEAIALEIEPDPSHRIAGLELTSARSPVDLPPQPALTLDEAVKELGALVDTLAKADAFSGSVLLAKDGKILFQAARGEAIKGHGAANRIDTKFNLGSMNKMFTAVAITQLAERGKLSLQDPLSKYLTPDWLPKVEMSKIRIEHLLTHTSGLGSYFNETYDRSSRELFRAVDDYKPLTAGETLAFEPGTKWQYSNTGFLLLGAVIEKVSGATYFDYVRRNIYEPAGMTGTDCYEMDLVVPNLAIGYSRERAKEGTIWRNNLYRHVIKGGPAGGGFSTAEDLFRFGEALRSHKILSTASTDLLWSPKPDLRSPEYGYGFSIGIGRAGKIVGHSGGFAGISSNLDLFLDSGFTAVTLSNYDEGSGPVMQKMRELIGRVKD